MSACLCSAQAGAIRVREKQVLRRTTRATASPCNTTETRTVALRERYHPVFPLCYKVRRTAYFSYGCSSCSAPSHSTTLRVSIEVVAPQQRLKGLKMRSNSIHPLTPCAQQLLQCCVALGTTQTARLAEHLCLSRHTINSSFHRINCALGTHDRFAAVQMALENGWISPKK